MAREAGGGAAVCALRDTRTPADQATINVVLTDPHAYRRAVTDRLPGTAQIVDRSLLTPDA